MAIMHKVYSQVQLCRSRVLLIQNSTRNHAIVLIMNHAKLTKYETGNGLWYIYVYCKTDESFKRRTMRVVN